MSDVEWNYVLSTSTVVSTVLQFLTGSLVCHKYIQKKSTGDSSGFPFVCGFLSCSLWFCYGQLTGDHSVVLVNIIGCALFFLYTLVYYVFTVNKSSVFKQFALASGIMLCSIGYIQYEPSIDKSIRIIGVLCCVVTVVFFAAPLTMLLHVIRTKNSESLPFPLILSTFIVSLQWLTYGVMMHDSFIQLPNFLGCVLTGTQLLLFVIYPARSHYSGPSYKLLEQSSVFQM